MGKAKRRRVASHRTGSSARSEVGESPPKKARPQRAAKPPVTPPERFRNCDVEESATDEEEGEEGVYLKTPEGAAEDDEVAEADEVLGDDASRPEECITPDESTNQPVGKLAVSTFFAGIWVERGAVYY